MKELSQQQIQKVNGGAIVIGTVAGVTVTAKGLAAAGATAYGVGYAAGKAKSHLEN
ncbi:MAG: hypothetical protein ACQEP9_09870 [Bacillota bacterium]